MTRTTTAGEWAALRGHFPVLEREVNGQPLCYLDSANTSLKPRAVLEAMAHHDEMRTSNVSRALHTLGAEATEAFESARAEVARFIGGRPEECVFTKNASEALNLAAHTLGAGLSEGDEVVVSVMEHHSNIVPWQLACERTGATLRWFDVTDDGRLDLDNLDGLINEHTAIVSVTAVSNVLGTVNPVRRIAHAAHAVGARMVVDAAQAVPHAPVDVLDWGADVAVFTGHKMCGPTGIGVLWGTADLLAELPPFLGGGEMIEIVRMTGSTWAAPPHRFEAGTPPITQAVGLGAACQWLSEVGMERIAAHEAELTAHALDALTQVPGLRLLGPATAADRGAALSFTLGDIHPHDVMQVLDSRGVAVRGGHHCARPLHERLGVHSSVRASLYLYSTRAEVDTLVDALHHTHEFFGGLS